VVLLADAEAANAIAKLPAVKFCACTDDVASPSPTTIANAAPTRRAVDGIWNIGYREFL